MHEHTMTNVRDESGRTVFLECIEHGCTLRVSARQLADAHTPAPRHLDV